MGKVLQRKCKSRNNYVAETWFWAGIGSDSCLYIKCPGKTLEVSNNCFTTRVKNQRRWFLEPVQARGCLLEHSTISEIIFKEHRAWLPQLVCTAESPSMFPPLKTKISLYDLFGTLGLGRIPQSWVFDNFVDPRDKPNRIHIFQKIQPIKCSAN